MNLDITDWHVERVTYEEYDKLVPQKSIFFNEPIFCELNKEKVDSVYYLIILKGDSARFGLILGRIGDIVKMPFSASYSYPVAIKKDLKVESYDCAIMCLNQYLINEAVSEIHIKFPPLYYDEHILSAWVSSFYRMGYLVENLDISYAIDLHKLNLSEEEYSKIITKKGRVTLKKALKGGLTVRKCITEEDYLKAYELVKIGHESKGFPVHMSYTDLKNTMRLVQSDAFIVEKDGIGVVGEFLYCINKTVVQGIYTGTNPEYLNLGGMNLLTYETIKYYAHLGYSILNKEIATEQSIPNYGLCDFKESVGCQRSLKFSFYKKLL